MAQTSFIEAVQQGQAALANKPAITNKPASDAFSWLRTPASGTPPQSLEEVIERANNYFTRCDDTETMPTLTGLALSLGLPSVSSIHRLGVKQSDTRYSLGRCLTTISYHYELGMAEGRIKSAVSTFMLKHLNAFDDEDPAGAPPARFWSDKQEVEVHVEGYVDHKVENLTPEQAYLRLVSGDNISSKTVLKAIEDADYEEVPANASPEDTAYRSLQRPESSGNDGEAGDEMPSS